MEDIKSSCENLLKQCNKNMMYRTQPISKENSSLTYLKNKMNIQNIQNKVSSQEKEEINRIIDKMKKKYHKKIKEPTIKKVELGEDLQTFTKEQLQRLHLIDEYQAKGLVYKEHINQQSGYIGNQASAVQRLKKMAKIDDILDQIRTNLDWGDMKQNAHSKIIEKRGFYKRNVSISHKNGFLPKFVKQRQCSKQNLYNTKYYFNNYFKTLLNNQSVGINFLKSDSDWPKRHNPNFEQMTIQQKLEIVKQQAIRNLSKIVSNKSIYMTEQRKSALYQCQILRLSKKLLEPKDYERLYFTLEDKKVQEDVQEFKGQSKIENVDKSRKAEEILEKNYNRIKNQRKRVIQKLIS